MTDTSNLINQRIFSKTCSTLNEQGQYSFYHEEKISFLSTSVLDLHSKKVVVGYFFSSSMMTELVLKSFDNAHFSQKPLVASSLHTDLGLQYTSSEFKFIFSKTTLLSNPLVNKAVRMIMPVLNPFKWKQSQSRAISRLSNS